MEEPKIMRRKSAILLAIALSVGLISSGLLAAKKDSANDHTDTQMVVANQTK